MCKERLISGYYLSMIYLDKFLFGLTEFTRENLTPEIRTKYPRTSQLHTAEVFVKSPLNVTPLIKHHVIYKGLVGSDS
jgi:hypothetical protein